MESFARYEEDMEVKIIPSAKATCVALVESVLLYGCEAWSLTVQIERNIDGVYTRMLRMVLNVSWQNRAKNVDLYGTLPRWPLCPSP